MSLNLKNTEVERLATEVAEMTGTSKTEAVRRGLAELRERLVHDGQEKAERIARCRGYLEREVWPHVPPDQPGRRLTKEEELLGYEPGEM